MIQKVIKFSGIDIFMMEVLSVKILINMMKREMWLKRILIILKEYQKEYILMNMFMMKIKTGFKRLNILMELHKL